MIARIGQFFVKEPGSHDSLHGASLGPYPRDHSPAVAATGWIVYLAGMVLRRCADARIRLGSGRSVETEGRGSLVGNCERSEAGSARMIPIAILLLLGIAGAIWLLFGPHRRFPDRFVEEAARLGLRIEGGNQERGWFSSTIRSARLSLQGAADITADIGRIDFQHWPFVAPRVTVRRVHFHLRGEPVALLETVALALRTKLAPFAVREIDVSYEHRVLGNIHFAGVTLAPGDSLLALQAGRAQVGDFVWSDVALAFERHKDMFVVAWGTEAAGARVQLSCFPSVGGTSRLILNLLHQAARPLVDRLGWKLGGDFDSVWVAGSISLDIPDDPAHPPHGQVQLILDHWPTGAPPSAEPLLGSTLSLLSNVVSAGDASRWELPRLEVTMPVFALVGKGSVKLDRDKRLIIEAEGERTCKQLRALLPPSPQLESVQRFLDRQPAKAAVSVQDPAPHAQLRVRWDTGAGTGFLSRPDWSFKPGCGLDPWPSASASDPADEQPKPSMK